MPSAAQLETLINSHYTGDEDHFDTVALQIAASEARSGHEQVAKKLEHLIDSSRRNVQNKRVISINQPVGELKSLLSLTYPKTNLRDMVLSNELKKKIDRILLEQKNSEILEEQGLTPRHKLILIGPPGTGKTMTASVIAGELGLPLFLIRIDSLISKYMGETSNKLRQVFDQIDNTLGVFFFDEFDAIGAERSLTNDVGESRRILNSFLQMVEQSNSRSLIMAATNHPEMLDSALYRRFDDVLYYKLPDKEHIKKILQQKLIKYLDKTFDFSFVVDKAIGLSYAELVKSSEEVIKTALIEKKLTVTKEDIEKAIAERQLMKKQLMSVIAR